MYSEDMLDITNTNVQDVSKIDRTRQGESDLKKRCRVPPKELM